MTTTTTTTTTTTLLLLRLPPGPFLYYQWKQLPNFLLAVPVVVTVVGGAWLFVRHLLLLTPHRRLLAQWWRRSGGGGGGGAASPLVGGGGGGGGGAPGGGGCDGEGEPWATAVSNNANSLEAAFKALPFVVHAAVLLAYGIVNINVQVGALASGVGSIDRTAWVGGRGSVASLPDERGRFADGLLLSSSQSEELQRLSVWGAQTEQAEWQSVADCGRLAPSVTLSTFELVLSGARNPTVCCSAAWLIVSFASVLLFQAFLGERALPACGVFPCPCGCSAAAAPAAVCVRACELADAVVAFRSTDNTTRC
jgi:hypothetical protein